MREQISLRISVVYKAILALGIVLLVLKLPVSGPQFFGSSYPILYDPTGSYQTQLTNNLRNNLYRNLNIGWVSLFLSLPVLYLLVKRIPKAKTSHPSQYAYYHDIRGELKEKSKRGRRFIKKDVKQIL